MFDMSPETWGTVRALIGLGAWNVGETGDGWLANAIPSEIEPNPGGGEKSGYEFDGFVGEKKLPTLDEASEPVLDG